MSRAGLDCSEYPCLLFAAEEATDEVADCLQVETRPSTGSGLSILGAMHYHDVPPAIRLRAEAREASRVEHLSAKTPPFGRASLHPPGLTCSRVSMDEELSCDEVLALQGCEVEDPSLSMTQEQARDHIESAHAYLEALEDRCEVLRSSSWFLDCERLPCVLGAPWQGILDRGLRFGDLTCGDPLSDNVRFEIAGREPDQVLMLPMLNVGDEETREINRLRWDAEYLYRRDDLKYVLGRGR